MAFRLIYEGPLKSDQGDTSRRKVKHELRRIFHKQLAQLWSEDPNLKWLAADLIRPDLKVRTLDAIADKYARCGYRFVPLVRKGMACSLDIVFLRRDTPGTLVRSGGDIDNRIKVLFDGLRMPENCSEIDGKADASEDPFYCLLEDDSSIIDVRVSTDRLLTPVTSDSNIHDVVLIIKAELHLFEDFRRYAFNEVGILG